MAQAASVATRTGRPRLNVFMRATSLRGVPATRAILLPVVAAITAVLGSCTNREADHVTIRFGIGGADAQVAERNLKLYVYDVELIDEHNLPHPLELTARAPWQSDRVALVDLAGTGERNANVTGTVAAGAERYTGIRFTVGVPFELNHANPLTARAPLDRADMFWTWQSGHKFLRVDLATDAREWSFHLGSTGCSSASALRPPQRTCTQPNLLRVELTGDPRSATVRLRVD